MESVVYRDYRIPEVRKIISSLVTSTMYQFTKVLVENDDLIFVVDDTLLYCMKLKNIDMNSNNPRIGVLFSDIVIPMEQGEDYFPYNNFNIVNEMINVHAFYSMKTNTSESRLLGFDDNPRANEEFEKNLELKADDGLKYYKLPRINSPDKCLLIPMFSGFPNLNKQDTIKLYVYAVNSKYDIVKMEIFKKKINRDMFIFYRVLKLT